MGAFGQTEGMPSFVLGAFVWGVVLLKRVMLFQPPLHFFLLVFLYDRLMYGVPPRKHSLEEMKFHNKCAV